MSEKQYGKVVLQFYCFDLIFCNLRFASLYFSTLSYHLRRTYILWTTFFLTPAAFWQLLLQHTSFVSWQSTYSSSFLPSILLLPDSLAEKLYPMQLMIFKGDSIKYSWYFLRDDIFNWIGILRKTDLNTVCNLQRKLYQMQLVLAKKIVLNAVSGL